MEPDPVTLTQWQRDIEADRLQEARVNLQAHPTAVSFQAGVVWALEWVITMLLQHQVLDIRDQGVVGSAHHRSHHPR